MADSWWPMSDLKPVRNGMAARDEPTSFSPEEIGRFLSKLREDEFCILYGEAKHNGYGRFSPSTHGRRKMAMMAHRVAWIINRGAIPPGLFVLHRCRNRACVNPNHLYLGTRSDNVQDALRDGTHRHFTPPIMEFCARGHRRTPENLTTSRNCKECLRERDRERADKGHRANA